MSVGGSVYVGIEIAGRVALPIWVIPIVTGWQLDPYMMLVRLADTDHDTYPCVFPTAFSSNNGRYCQIEQVTLKEILNNMGWLEKEAENRAEWVAQSKEILYRYSGMYVWLDEFRNWFAHYVCKNNCDYDTYTLQPFLDSELASQIKAEKSKALETQVPLNFLESSCKDMAVSGADSVVTGDLLAFTIVDLLDKYFKRNEYESESGYNNEKRFYLSLWKFLLNDEAALIYAENYDDEAKREENLKNIYDKIKEIVRCLAICPIEPDKSFEFVYRKPELMLDDAISLYPALKLLGNDWIAEELGLQILNSMIRVFDKPNHGDEKLRQIFNAARWLREEALYGGEEYTIKKALLKFKFSKSELSRFKPQFRYIPFQQARDQIAILIGDVKDAEDFLINALNQSRIRAYHPFVGLVRLPRSLDIEFIRKVYFEKWRLDDLIAKELVGEIETQEELPQLKSIPENLQHDENCKMPYSVAKAILKHNYNATQEEIVWWIETKEIIPKDCWHILNVGGQKKEVLIPCLSSLEPNELIFELESLYFNEDEINNFVPIVRWITFRQVVERWEKYGENDISVAAKLYLHGSMPNIKERIGNGENIDLEQYPIEVIEKIEKELFSQFPESKAEIETEKLPNCDANSKVANDLNHDPRILYRHKFDETLTLSKLIELWQTNSELETECARSVRHDILVADDTIIQETIEPTKTIANGYTERDKDFIVWLIENYPEIAKKINKNATTKNDRIVINIKKAAIYHQLENRNSIWTSGFDDWWRQQLYVKGKHGRHKTSK